MFDWNEEELTSIIWDEDGKSDDHIVPYPDQIEEKHSILFGDPPKKEKKQQISNTSPPELKNPPTKAENVVELDSISKYETGELAIGFGHTSCSDGPDPSSSNVAKAEPGSEGATLSKNITKNTQNGSLIDETTQVKKDSELFENPPQDGEQGDFVDFGWANIGSFDDLDRIFSNQDPLFGDMSGGHTDELWSQDVTSSSLGSTPLSRDSSDLPFGSLRTSTGRSEIKTDCMLDTSQPFTSGYKKLNNGPLDVQASLDNIEYFGGKNNLLGKEKTPATSGRSQACLTHLTDGTAATPTQFPGKANRQQRLPKGQKLEKKNKVRQLHNLSRTWNPTGSTLQQLNNQYAPSMINRGPPLVLTQQSSLMRPDAFQQKYFLSAPLGTPVYGNMVNSYPMTSVVPQFHPADKNHELMSSSYEVQPTSSNSVDAAVKPPAMTPREKIEKLRRRQQMRAILAIQKQQLQFGNQASVSEHSGMEGGSNEVNESLGTFPSLEPNSPGEQHDSNTISMAVDNSSVEELVLYRLQDTIAKLDVQLRLCIRDSLFRLAQSAVQRLCHNGKSSTSISSRDEVVSDKDIVGHDSRFTRISDEETETNPIDRTMAHLLFHRPLESSAKPGDGPDSPLSPNLLLEKKANPSESLTKRDAGESSWNTQITSPNGSKTVGMFCEGDRPKNGPTFITHENACRAGGATRPRRRRRRRLRSRTSTPTGTFSRRRRPIPTLTLRRSIPTLTLRRRRITSTTSTTRRRRPRRRCRCPSRFRTTSTTRRRVTTRC